MRLDQEFSVEDLPVSDRSYEPIPAGWYPCVIKSAELRNTKIGTGKMIAIRFDILGDNHPGRVVFTNINIRNANPVAERIGAEQLGELLRASGLPRLSDTDQLIGLQIQIKVDIKKSEQYGDSNEVKGYKAFSAGVTLNVGTKAAIPAATSASSEPLDDENLPPWMRQK